MSVLEEWVESAHDEVLLPSGMRVRLRRPEPQQLISRNLLPKQLRLAVLTSGGDAERTREAVSDETATALQEINEAMDSLIALSIRAVRRGESDSWEQVNLTPEQLHDLPADDLDALRRIVNGMPPEEVTIRVRRWRKEITDDEAAAMLDALTERRVESWLSFRPLRRSTPVGAPSEDVGPAPVEPRQRPRSNRRARAG